MAPLFALIPAIAGGIGAATSIGALASQPGAPKPQVTSTPAATEAAANAQATALTKRRGMASTILSSPFSGGGTQTQKATLGA